jgi:hypothetical protein
MSRTCRRYTFSDGVCWDDVVASLLLTTWATGSLHGETALKLDCWFQADHERHILLVDFNSPVGRDLDRILCGYLRREFDAQQFQIDVISVEEPKPHATASAS